LPEYIENLKKLITHSNLKPHDPKFILVAPPPICEYMTQEDDTKKGKNYVQRLAARTKEYADAAVAVGKELGVPTVNLWQAFTDYAGGWKEGEPLPGCKDCAPNEKLQSLLRDGLHFNPKG
jgi:lysophospholipase L1-like esterase